MASVLCHPIAAIVGMWEGLDSTHFAATSCIGGSVTAGLGIYDTIQYIKPPVATWCVGQACSMGAFLLAAGE